MPSELEPTGLPAPAIAQIRAVLASHPAIAEAILYGSRAKGNFRPGSDIDLALRGEALSSREWLRIENELDELSLPYKIDLCCLHDIDNPALLAHIERVGKVFHRRESTAANA